MSPDAETGSLAGNALVYLQSTGDPQVEHAEEATSEKAPGSNGPPANGNGGTANGKKVPFDSNDPYMYLAGALGPLGGGLSAGSPRAASEASLPLHWAQGSGSATEQPNGAFPSHSRNGYAHNGAANNGSANGAANGTVASHMEKQLSGAPAAYRRERESAEEGSLEEGEEEQGRVLEAVADAEARAEAGAEDEAWAQAAMQAQAAAEAAIVAVAEAEGAGTESEGGAARVPRRPKGMMLLRGRRGKNSDLLGVPGVGPRNLEKLKASGIKEVATLTKVYREKVWAQLMPHRSKFAAPTEPDE